MQVCTGMEAVENAQPVASCPCQPATKPEPDSAVMAAMVSFHDELPQGESLERFKKPDTVR
jgi:hypothetical protein